MSSGMKRSTPIAGRVSSGRRTNVKLQPPDLDRGRRATSNRRFDPRCLRRTNVNSASAAVPSWETGESESSSGRTRATGITHPGFYGRKPWKKPNSTLIIDVPRPAKEGLRRPFPEPPPNRSQNFTGNPSHSPSCYRHNSPKVRRRRSSRFLSALRVSKSAVCRQLTCPLRSKPLSGNLAGGSVMPWSSSRSSSNARNRSSVRSRTGPFLVGVRRLHSPPLDDHRPRIPEHLLVVLGGLPRHQVGVLPPQPGSRRRLPAHARRTGSEPSDSAWEGPAPA